MGSEGLMIRPSRFGQEETIERLEAALSTHGMSVMARIDHAAAAAEVGLSLRPTLVLFFGNPRAGTPLMQAHATVGIDLPLRALISTDEHGKTWLALNDPFWLAERHHLATDAMPAVSAMSQVLQLLGPEATGETIN